MASPGTAKRGGLPLTMAGAPWDTRPTRAFYEGLLSSPFADALALDFARAAIAGEALGQDDTPDILAISLSGHDYVNHQWSAESRLSHDHLLQLDRLLQAFFQHLDSTVGKDRYVAVLTADHGFTPNPEHSQSQGRDAGRVDTARMLARLNEGLARRFEVPKLVAFTSASALVLDRQLLAAHRLELDTVAAAARELLLAEPGIQVAYTRQELRSGSRAGAPFFLAMQRSWHPEVSGDVPYALKENWMSGTGVATHGSPYPTDTQVPMLFYGPAWWRPGRIDTRVEVVDIAPTLAQLLGVATPASSEGKPLPLAVPAP